jgi:hypothetical protein
VGSCLVENVLPALLGAALGMAGGILAVRVFDHELLPGAAGIQPDLLVVGYALGGAVLAGILAGLASLIPFRRLVLAQALHEAGRGSTGRNQAASWFGHLAGRDFVRPPVWSRCPASSLRELMRVDPGFQVSDVWTQPGDTLLEALREASARRQRTRDDCWCEGLC